MGVSPSRLLGIKPLKPVSFEGPKALDIQDSNSDIGSVLSRKLLNLLGNRFRDIVGHDDGNANRMARNMMRQIPYLQNGLSYERDHAVSSSFGRPLDFDYVLLACVFGNEARLFFLDTRLFEDLPPSFTKHVDDQALEFCLLVVHINWKKSRHPDIMA
jgi:hypothetical protein